MVYLGVFPTALAFTTWAYALARTTAGRMGATTYAVPALVVLMSWLALGEGAGATDARGRRAVPGGRGGVPVPQAGANAAPDEVTGVAVRERLAVSVNAPCRTAP